MPINRGPEGGRPGGEPTPEKEPKNPYTLAGYKTGDHVVYKYGSAEDGEDLAQIEITGPLGDRVNGGAWLLVYAGRKITTKPSANPDKCRIYRYPSEERSIEAYSEMLAKINSKAELVNFFHALARSGLQPNHPEIGIAAENWEEVAAMYNNAEAIYYFNPKYACPEFTKLKDLRLNIQRILGLERAKSPIGMFSNMAVGDIIKIDQDSYLKVAPDRFHKLATHSNVTAQITSTPAKEVEALAHQVDPSKLRIFTAKEQHDAAALEEKPKVSESFKALLPELYASRVGLAKKMADLLAKAVGHSRPALYDDIVKYLPHSEISQGSIGDCYLLAGINSLKKTHPELYLATLSNSLRKGTNPGDWQVKFQGLNLAEMQSNLGAGFDGWIMVKQSDLLIWSLPGASADLPDVILERAYASYISRRNQGEIGKTMVWNPKRRFAMEGGLGHRALHDILGPEVASKQMIADYGWTDGNKTLTENLNADAARDFLTHSYTVHPERFVVTANTPRKKGFGDSMNVKGQKFYFRHAYSVIKVAGNNVDLENPHDTSKPISLSIEDFVNTFSQISYVEIKNGKK